MRYLKNLIRQTNILLDFVHKSDTHDFSSNNNQSQFSDFSQNSHFSQKLRFLRKKTQRFLKRSTILPFGAVLFIVIAIAIFGISRISDEQTPGAALGQNDKRVELQAPIAQDEINKSFSFPLKGADDKVVSNLKYEILNAELRKEIIIKGQKATSVKGRVFLVINLKITNSYDKSIQINTRDYLRLLVSASTEKLAPDIHNDPVEIQAISTKYTRLGFPINDTDTNLTLQVGEISGNKEYLKLNLK